jgi:hypothetical protein
MAYDHCATFRNGIEAQLRRVRRLAVSALAFCCMKTIQLNLPSLPEIETVFEANACVKLIGLRTDLYISAVAGFVWISVASPLCKHSASPLVDIALAAGQSYCIEKSVAAKGVIISTFEQSTVRFFLKHL